MSLAEERDVERRRFILLLPLMIACNAFLFLCMVGLGIVGIGGGNLHALALSGDGNQQIVRDYLAERVPGGKYRIRGWFPATGAEGNLRAIVGSQSEPVTDKGAAQGVALVFYGPGGARQLDTVYWIQNGKVTRTLEAGPSRFAREL